MASAVQASTVEELVAAWERAKTMEQAVIELAAGDYELATTLELSSGRVIVRGPKTPAPRKLLPWVWRSACTAVVAAVGGGMSWSHRLAGWSVAMLGTEAWLRAAANRAEQPGAHLARVVARDGALLVTGGEVRLEQLSMASLGSRGVIRCGGTASLIIADSDVGCMGGNGIECESEARVEVASCTVANCGRSGVAMLGRGCCSVAISRCTFSRNRRFGCELQGGKVASIEHCTFDGCGACVSDRERWEPESSVLVASCVLRGCAACLPGLSVIGDNVPGLEAWTDSDFVDSDDDDRALVPGILFDSCVIERVNGAGVYLLGRHTVRLRACTIRQASMAGIEALRGVRVVVSRSKVFRNAGGGIVLHRGARGALSACELVANGGGGNCGVMDDASCSLRDCAINRARAVGIQVCRGSVRAMRCTIEGSGESGILVGGHDSRSCQDRRHDRPCTQTARSYLSLRDSRVAHSGSSALIVAPHTRRPTAGCYDRLTQVEHTVVVADCHLVDSTQAIRIEAPARGCLAGNDCQAPQPNDLANWLGLPARMSWHTERLLHCGASAQSSSPLRVIKDRALLRLIVEFAS